MIRDKLVDSVDYLACERIGIKSCQGLYEFARRYQSQKPPDISWDDGMYLVGRYLYFAIAIIHWCRGARALALDWFIKKA